MPAYRRGVPFWLWHISYGVGPGVPAYRRGVRALGGKPRELARVPEPYKVMAYVVMTYIVKAYIVKAYIVMT